MKNTTVNQVSDARMVRIIPASKSISSENEYFFKGSETILPNPYPVRVAAYCRVSTEDDNQHNSYTAQIAYYTQYIASHPGWICAGIFADEGLSGTQTSKRKEFNRLIRICNRRQIDIILCKSISRFARNTVDCLTYIRSLKMLGIAVIFEKENLNTLSLSSEFIISLHASFAQAESESISNNITWGIEKAFRAGRFPYHFSCMMGYQIGQDGTPEIIEEEASVVREIYKLFAGGQSMGRIAVHMTELQIRRRCGSIKWSRKNVEKILRNEKYAGFAILQKTYTTNCLTHERAVNHGERPKYIVQNCLPPIIDMELYEKVQSELQRRKGEWLELCEARNQKKTKSLPAFRMSEETEKSHPVYILNSLLYCPYCGSRYRRAIWQSGEKRYAVWRCGARLDRGKNFCPKSVSVHEDVLEKYLCESVFEHFSLSAGLMDRFATKKSTRLESLISFTAESAGGEELDLYISRIEVWKKDCLHIWFCDGKDKELTSVSL